MTRQPLGAYYSSIFWVDARARVLWRTSPFRQVALSYLFHSSLSTISVPDQTKNPFSVSTFGKSLISGLYKRLINSWDISLAASRVLVEPQNSIVPFRYNSTTYSLFFWDILMSIVSMLTLFKLVPLLGFEPRLTSNLEFGGISPVVLPLHYRGVVWWDGSATIRQPTG